MTKGDAPDTQQMNQYVHAKVAAALNDGIEEIIKLSDDENKQQDIFDLSYLENIQKLSSLTQKFSAKKTTCKSNWRNEKG